jgi:outer membrane immunogenic protein
LSVTQAPDRTNRAATGVKMKKLLLSLVVTAGCAGSALAADLPSKAPRISAPPPMMTSWTGCYLGAGGGYGFFNQDVSTVVGATGVSSSEITVGGRGWFGTVQAGCDYQFANRWVIGAFGDFDWSGQKGNMTWPRGAVAVGNGTIVGEERLEHSWAVGARVGYVVLPQLLAYISGGYTEAQFSQINPSFAFSGVAALTFLPATTYDGWFIGTGYEYSLDFLPGLFWKTEYRYASYGQRDVPFTTAATGLATGDFIRADKSVHTVRSELVWRFNFGGPGPVMAKY